MALWPLAPLAILWLLMNREPSAPGDPQAGMPDNVIELCYEIEGYTYQVYEIKRPDGTSHREGGDPYFFIGTAPDLSTVLQGASGPSTYNTKQKAINALTSMWEAQNDPNAPSRGTTDATGGTEYETQEEGGSKAKKADLSKEQDKIVVAEGREEDATLEELDVELYDGDGSLIDQYNVTDRAGQVQTTTDLGGRI